ncbi:MAG TPA: AIR synthase-related protein, partial [Methanocorpusculum sp.]|nr:AIR synthase-related protein [Methanocorpusculum sp.]
CIGGAIRDPLSGRSYVYTAMRLTGSGNPLKPINTTIPGKLPQRKIVTSAANGYSSYGNQIGISTGIVDEIYHDGYIAKHMEVGAVIGAVPYKNVQRSQPIPGDLVILIGGKTGRDGCGGATGSSKSHTTSSIESCGAEVQKGNAPEERKIQRLFRNPNASILIKRCNDFGAGGVSVAIGELADGLKINLNAIPKKYEDLDGTELSISESQERMAVVVSKSDALKFIDLAHTENIEATIIAEVTEDPRLVMIWNGNNIVDISRDFLSSNGVTKHTNVVIPSPKPFQKTVDGSSFKDSYIHLADDLNVCSKRGLSEQFDSTIGSGTVLMPFGGKYQLTPIQAMVTKIPVENGYTNTCSVMSWGFNPYIMEKSQYHGAYLAVIESVSKLIATGADINEVYLSFQEYFEKLGNNATIWGKPTSALLGAFKAQMDLGIASIGGKDSMSGSFEQLSVPPTLISFAVTTEKTQNIISNDFKAPNHRVIFITPEYDTNQQLPIPESLLSVYNQVIDLIHSGQVISCWTPVYGGVAEGILKMAIGNGIGFTYSNSLDMNTIFGYNYGSFILELSNDSKIDHIGVYLGTTTDNPVIKYRNESINLKDLQHIYESKLESVYSRNIIQNSTQIQTISYKSRNTTKP